MLLNGDARKLLGTLDDCSIDSIVTDPPYELGFMGKSWDNTGIAYDVELWAECLRVLKPGGHLLAFGSSRTYHRLACAVEDAGFEIRDQIAWAYGSGFPKSMDVSKAIDKAAGSTSAAQQWQGWGTALKPAFEPLVVARKPLSEKTVAANVLEHGTGALNIDGCRVLGPKGDGNWAGKTAERGYEGGWDSETKPNTEQNAQGRWPANFIWSHHVDCDRTEGGWVCSPGCPSSGFPAKAGAAARASGAARVGESGSIARGRYSGTDTEAPYYGDTGSAARFFASPSLSDDDARSFIYCAKASKAERNAGIKLCQCVALEPLSQANKDGALFCAQCDGLRGGHPTVKPLALMRYLVRLVTPPGGVVLDPFLGSGTTALAAITEGFEWVGCEITEDYWPIIEARVRWAAERASELA